MKHYILEPEVAGALGPRSVVDTSTSPPTVIALDYEFITWLGDDLLEAYPTYIVTERLRTALEQFGGTGYTFADLIVSHSEGFHEVTPHTLLPSFT